MNFSIAKKLLGALLLVGLSACACGGGGGGGGGTTPDTTPPTVSSTSPASAATGVAVNAAITATFSETMDAATITSANFTLNNGVNGAVTYSGTTATFTPSTSLTYSITYTATISTAVKDAAGNALAVGKIWSFTTTPPINDTGMTKCYDDTAEIACDSVNALDTGAHPSQDAKSGRDAQAAALTLNKIGAGAAGFDYTKVCFNGSLNCATVASNAAAPAATDWACTKDNVTNLVWSLETQADTWANAITLPTAANTATRCGFNTGWRLPTRRELLSLVHNGVSIPAIDSDYFPGTVVNFYWSNDTYVPYPASAWFVDFDIGNTSALVKSVSNSVRLVRSGQ